MNYVKHLPNEEKSSVKTSAPLKQTPEISESLRS